MLMNMCTRQKVHLTSVDMTKSVQLFAEDEGRKYLYECIDAYLKLGSYEKDVYTQWNC